VVLSSIKLFVNHEKITKQKKEITTMGKTEQELRIEYELAEHLIMLTTEILDREKLENKVLAMGKAKPIHDTDKREKELAEYKKRWLELDKILNG